MTTKNVYVADYGCQIRAAITGGKISVTNDGGCGPDCLGKRVPTHLNNAGLVALLRDRFVRKASRNMGAKYDPDANNLVVRVD